MNTMMNVYLKEDEAKSDALVFRIFFDFGELAKQVNMTKDREVLCLQFGHSVGVTQRVNAIFCNGVAYGYAQGRTLEYDDVTKPHIIK